MQLANRTLTRLYSAKFYGSMLRFDSQLPAQEQKKYREMAVRLHKVSKQVPSLKEAFNTVKQALYS